MTQALEGIKVLDLTRAYPSAAASMVLADFGADVIRVDPVGTSIIRLPYLKVTEAEFAAYLSQNRNKRSIKVNFRSEQGREVVYKLARESDVFLENSRPGTMERLGMSYETLKGINPRLIYCSVSGYGQDGPYRDLIGHDANFLGVSGVLSLIGPKDGPPTPPSNIVEGMAGAGLCPVIGILIALIAGEKTGRGKFVDISYTDGAFSLLSFEVTQHFLTGKVRMRGETVQTGAEPCASV